ncbi:NTP transferase domain-containing protein [Nesterenkonia pannonica]|uniref:nucleotidyltransferase family protein n=1 Tax=Nesterenkonia pannonica TaxID=1548602 RepID=UPI002164ACD3|nr:NTP transferase domain-containing protein [Nesterenkonia pannonica]
MARTVAVILAAGAGRRLGGLSKPLLRWNGRTLSGLAMQAAHDAGTEPLLVLGHRSDEVLGTLRAEEADLLSGTSVVHLQQSCAMADSLQAGVHRAAEGAADHVLLMLVDQPSIGAAAARAVLAAHRRQRITRGRIQGQPSHPVLLDTPDALAAAALAVGDEGARRFLRQHEHRTTWVPLDGIAEAWDVDAPGDLKRLRGGAAGRCAAE